MKNSNLFQTLTCGLMLGATLLSTHAMATDYDLGESGIYREVPVSPVGYDFYTSSTIDFEGEFSDTFTFIAPEGHTWSLSASARNWNGMLETFTEISYQNYIGYSDPYSAELGEFSLYYYYEYYEYYYYDDNELWWNLNDGAIIIAPGEHTISVSGIAAMDGAQYDMNIFLTSVSPVPEPSSIALMLGGLGLVGFMAARRRKLT